MGLDIHFFIEHKKNEKWEVNKHYCEGLDRDYELFCLLARLRCPDEHKENTAHISIGSIKRGVPNDCSKFIKDYFDWTIHSVSYFYLQELMNFDWKACYHGNGPITYEAKVGFIKYPFNGTYEDRFKNFIELAINPMKSLDENFENVRCVFGFDG